MGLTLVARRRFSLCTRDVREMKTTLAESCVFLTITLILYFGIVPVAFSPTIDATFGTRRLENQKQHHSLTTGEDSFLDKAFQPHEIRRRRENRRLLNEMFLAYELKLATEEERKEYDKFQKQFGTQEYNKEMQQQQQQQQPHPHQQQHQSQQQRQQTSYRPYSQKPLQPPFQQHHHPGGGYETSSSFQTVHPDNPHPKHSYDWEREEHSRRHSYQYQQQKELQRAFIEGNMGTPGSSSGTDSVGGSVYDPFQQGMRQPHMAQHQHVPTDEEEEDFYRFRSCYNQNPYLHEEPLVMGGNLGGTSARAGRRPPSPGNDPRHRRRSSPASSAFSRPGGGSTGPLFAHDPFLSSVFGYEDDDVVSYRSHQRHEQQGRSSHSMGKSAPSNNHIWGVEDPHMVDSQYEGTVVVEDNGGYYEYPYGKETPKHESASSSSSHSQQHQGENYQQHQQPYPERELFRDAVQSNREQQQEQARERSRQQRFYEEGDVLYVRGPLVGFVEVSNIPYNLGRVEDLEYAKAGMRSPKRPLVSHLAVERRARNSGIGSQLLEACERHVQVQWNAKEIILEVEENDDNGSIGLESDTVGLSGSVAVINYLNRRGYEVLFAEPSSQRYDPETGGVLEQIQHRKDVMHKFLVNKKHRFDNDDDNEDRNDGVGNSNGSQKQGMADNQPSRRHDYAAAHDVVDVEYFESVDISDHHGDAGGDEQSALGAAAAAVTVSATADTTPPSSAAEATNSHDATSASASASVGSETHRPRRKIFEIPVDSGLI